jgi:hypothetical protein
MTPSAEGAKADKLWRYSAFAGPSPNCCAVFVQMEH